MNAQIIGVTVDLADGPVRAEYSRSRVDGRQTARLVIGEGSQSIGIAITDSPEETLAQLEAAVAELRAWTQRQQMLSALPEVAA